MTDVGYCHTISGWKFKSPTDTLRIDIASEHDESVMLQIHSHKSLVALKSNGIRVPRGMKVMVTVVPQKESFLEDGNWGTCSRIWTRETIHNNDIYDMTTCEKYCIAKQFIKNCSCVPFFHEIPGIRVCSLAESIHCKPIEMFKNDCRCPLECDRILYNYPQHSYLKKGAFERNVVTIEISFGTKKLHILQQQKRIKAVDLLSYVAGSMGLFLGMSCVTLLEIFIYLFKTVWGVFNDQRHKSYLDNLLGKDSDNDNGPHDEIVITTKLQGSPISRIKPSLSSILSIEKLRSNTAQNENNSSGIRIQVVWPNLARRISLY